VHHLLADAVGEPGLRDPERPGGDRHRDHAGDEDVEQRRVEAGAGREHAVEQLAQEEGRDHAQAGGDEDEAQEQHQAAAVGAEEPGDAPAQPPPLDLGRGGLGERGCLRCAHIREKRSRPRDLFPRAAGSDGDRRPQPQRLEVH
jgi:hypothetical protein